MYQFEEHHTWDKHNVVTLQVHLVHSQEAYHRAVSLTDLLDSVYVLYSRSIHDIHISIIFFVVRAFHTTPHHYSFQYKIHCP